MEERTIEVSRTARYFISDKPAKHPRKLWFCLHGYGQLASDLFTRVAPLAAGSIVVAPEGLSRFYTRGGAGPVGASWMTKESRASEINDYCNYLNQLLSVITKDMVQEYEINILGFSQGAATASRWFEQLQVPVKNLVLWGAVFPPDMNQAVLRRNECKTWLFAGKNDQFLSLETVELFRDQVDHVIVYEGGHEIDSALLVQHFS